MKNTIWKIHQHWKTRQSNVHGTTWNRSQPIFFLRRINCAINILSQFAHTKTSDIHLLFIDIFSFVFLQSYLRIAGYRKYVLIVHPFLVYLSDDSYFFLIFLIKPIHSSPNPMIYQMILPSYSFLIVTSIDQHPSCKEESKIQVPQTQNTEFLIFSLIWGWVRCVIVIYNYYIDAKFTFYGNLKPKLYTY